MGHILMTELLDQAFAKARTLTTEAQNALAQHILAEIEAEERWQTAFAQSEDLLGQIADDVLAAHHAGKTTPLNLDDL